MTPKPRLLFISPRYLLPPDSGGKIRTGHVLKGLKGGRFHVTLLSPGPETRSTEHTDALAEMCDEFETWPEQKRGPLFAYTRMRHLASALPIPVATDRSAAGSKAVSAALSRNPDIVVVDFLHAAVLLPKVVRAPMVLFTHNVEAEIFSRHAKVAGNSVLRAVLQDQFRKMARFECETLQRFDSVIAVSQRDCDQFRQASGVEASLIPTGVDLDYFGFHALASLTDSASPVVAFTASMDSLANIDGIRWFMDSVWPLIAREFPKARMNIIGRNPDAGIVQEAKRRGLQWNFTGYVEDVRPYLEESTVYVIPLRVGGGTRIKAYEAMAFGRPMVSTSIGIEGLSMVPGEHFLLADTEVGFAEAVLKLLRDDAMRLRIASEARNLVESNFSSRAVAMAFEDICLKAVSKRAFASSQLID